VVNLAHIRIIGPDAAGVFVVEFRKHTGERLAFVTPPNAGNDVLNYFQERMPYGVAVPDLDVTGAGAHNTATGKRSY